MEDVSLETRLGIPSQHDGVTNHYEHQIMAYINQRYENRDWTFWFNNLIAVISEPNLASFLIAVFCERDGLQDQSTDGIVTFVSTY